MIIKKIPESDKEKLDHLIKKIEMTLDNKLWWLPISKKSYDNFFNEKWSYFLGMYNGDELIAASALFFNENEYGDTLKELNLKYEQIAEIGRSMVLKEYRGNNNLYCLNKKLLEIAKIKGIKKIIVTIHPNNISSQCSFRKLGMKRIATITKNELYDRDVFVMDI